MTFHKWEKRNLVWVYGGYHTIDEDISTLRRIGVIINSDLGKMKTVHLSQ